MCMSMSCVHEYVMLVRRQSGMTLFSGRATWFDARNVDNVIYRAMCVGMRLLGLYFVWTCRRCCS